MLQSFDIYAIHLFYQQPFYSSILVLAASTLTKLIGRPNVQLPVEERLALRNYILQYLAQRGPKLPNFVSQALVTLFGRITKLGW